MNPDIPEESIRRLPLYLRYLNRLLGTGKEKISSQRLGKEVDVKPAQIRKDLSYFGEFGTPGIGYDTQKLVSELRSILNLDKEWKIALVGVGKIGQALLTYPGFKKQGLKIQVAFDNHPQLIGKEIGGVRIDDVSKLEQKIEEEEIKLAIIAVPSPSAQEVAETLVSSGVNGILNFAPCLLDLPEDIKVSYVDIAIELGRLVYYL